MEIENLKVTFDILQDGSKTPFVCNKASGYFVFDTSMTLGWKDRWEKDGNVAPEPEWSDFAGVVSRESTRIALTHAALKGMPFCDCDTQNAYLKAHYSEKHYVICGPQFVLENVSKCAIIVRAIGSGKSSGADYWWHVDSAMENMVFSSYKVDPDVCLLPALKPNRAEHYQCILLYTVYFFYCRGT